MIGFYLFIFCNSLAPVTATFYIWETNFYISIEMTRFQEWVVVVKGVREEGRERGRESVAWIQTRLHAVLCNSSAPDLWERWRETPFPEISILTDGLSAPMDRWVPCQGLALEMAEMPPATQHEKLQPLGAASRLQQPSPPPPPPASPHR